MSAITSTVEEKSSEPFKQLLTTSHDFMFNLFYHLGVGTSTSKTYVLLTTVIETIQLIALLFPNDNMLIPWNETNAGYVRIIVESIDYVRENYLPTNGTC